MLIATIRKGYKIKTADSVFEVVGSNKLRGCYYYLVRDQAGQVRSINRDAVMAGQKSGDIAVTA